MSGIVATLAIGSVVDQVDKSAGWVKIVTDDGRTGWMRETDLSEIVDTSPPPTIAEERTELHTELEAVENTQLEALVTQIQQVAQNREAEANRPATGWQFATDAAKVVIRRSYTLQAVIALIMYTLFWIPGLVLNIVFLNQANKDQGETGKAPEGKGCLVWLLWVFGILPVVALVLLIALGIAVGEETTK
jgi:hypothetical protein